MSHERWYKRLSGEKVISYVNPDEGDCGFYKLPIRVKQENGRWQVVSYEPVGLYVDPFTKDLRCRIGDRDVDDTEMGEAWPWFVKHPIDEATYMAVMDGHGWPKEETFS